MFPNSQYLTKLLIDTHVEELRRAGARSRLARAATDDSPRPVRRPELPIAIRPARAAGGPRLRKPAEGDSAAVPPVPVPIAEADGERHPLVASID